MLHILTEYFPNTDFPSHLIVAHNIDGPSTEPSSSIGLGANVLRVKLWITEVLLLHCTQTLLRYVLLIIVHQSLQEVIQLQKKKSGSLDRINN